MQNTVAQLWLSDGVGVSSSGSLHGAIGSEPAPDSCVYSRGLRTDTIDASHAAGPDVRVGNLRVGDGLSGAFSTPRSSDSISF